MSRASNLTNSRFGSLVARVRLTSNRHGQARWWCDCDCGRQAAVTAGNLKSGLVTSCGCSRRRARSQ